MNEKVCIGRNGQILNPQLEMVTAFKVDRHKVQGTLEVHVSIG